MRIDGERITSDPSDNFLTIRNLNFADGGRTLFFYQLMFLDSHRCSQINKPVIVCFIQFNCKTLTKKQFELSKLRITLAMKLFRNPNSFNNNTV